MNIFNLERAFADKARKKWDKLYIAVDVHDCILEGKYSLLNEGANYFPNALNVLGQWTKRKDICLILWTSSHAVAISKVLDDLQKNVVYFNYVNSNPECPNNTLCDFSKKFYANVMLDDKSGFDANGGDWFLIEKELKRIGEWKV